MTVDEGTRADVYASFKEAHGERIANAIMGMLPPAGVPELATKADLAVLKADFDGLRAEFGGLRGEFGGLEAKVDGFRAEFRSEMSALEARMGERLERALKDQTTRYVGWMFAAIGLTTTITAGIIALG